MEWLKKSWIKLGIRISGFLFLIGATAFTIAYFTTDIPDPNEYVNSQSTIIQFSDGDEVGRIGAQNRTIIPLAGVPQDLRRAVLADYSAICKDCLSNPRSNNSKKNH